MIPENRLISFSGRTFPAKRVSKQQARILVAEGQTIYLCPANIRMPNMWLDWVYINTKVLATLGSFDYYIFQYQYYTCNRQIGTYPKYYVETK